MRSLPPFDALVAFDTALRHRSMTRAAAELGMTQSAVSHRLRRLEARPIATMSIEAQERHEKMERVHRDD